MKPSIKFITTAIIVLTTTLCTAFASTDSIEKQLVGTWFVEVAGVSPDGKYQNIMNVDEGGTADIVGGWMFGAGGIKFTDSPASVVSINGNEFTINMFAFIVDAKTGAPTTLNATVYRATMDESGKKFTAEADVYFLPCSIESCPSPDPDNFGEPAVVGKVTGFKLATPVERFK